MTNKTCENTTVAVSMVKSWCKEVRTYSEIKYEVTTALVDGKDAFVEVENIFLKKQEYRFSIAEELPEYARHFLE